MVIKESIRKHEKSLPIQEDCLGIFAHATNETSRDSIAADAGVELILKVLHANKDRRALQRDGLKVMQLLGEVSEYRDEIRAGGGLMIVLEAMGNFPMLTSIQINAVNMLRVLASGRDERLLMKKMRCAHAIVNAMQMYRIDDCPELHTDSVHTLRCVDDIVTAG